MYGYLEHMVPLIEEYLRVPNNDIHTLMAVAERDFLLQSYEVKEVLAHIKNKNNPKQQLKTSQLK